MEEGQKDCVSQGTRKSAARLFLLETSIVGIFTHYTSTVWLFKQALNNDCLGGDANGKGKSHKVLPSANCDC